MFAFDGWLFVAGLSLFIYAIRLLEESLKALAGRPFKKYLQRQTAHPLKAIAGGAIVTAILQSSSVVLLITLSFVGAGVLSMRNALAFVLGANLGATFDSWIIAWLGFRFDIGEWSFPLLGIALLGLLFLDKNRIASWWTRFLIGFSLLFIGLAYVKNAFTDDQAINFLSHYVQYSPYWFILLGFLITALIQSSFATMAIALAMLNARQLPLEYAAAMVVGSELGTSIKLLFGAMKGSLDKKRVAWGNFYFNVLSLIVGSFFLIPLIHLLNERFFPGEPLFSLVCFSSFLNLIVTVISFPFLGTMASWLEREINVSQPSKVVSVNSTISSDNPIVMLNVIRHESIDLLKDSMTLNRIALGINGQSTTEKSSFLFRLKKWSKEKASFMEEYRRLKLLQGEQLQRCAELLLEELNPEESDLLSRLIKVLRNITHSTKNIKDIRHNLKELNDTANDELYGLLDHIRKDEMEFYRFAEASLLLIDEGSHVTKEGELEANRSGQQRRIEHALTLLHNHAIKEYEASTLMNIYRELYSSHKAILQTLQDLALNRQDSMDTT